MGLGIQNGEGFILNGFPKRMAGMSEVTYSKKNDEIECVRYEKSRKTYLPHTHPNHLTIVYIEEGRVCITIDGESCIYAQGEEFRMVLVRK